MKSPYIDLTGQRFSSLVVIENRHIIGNRFLRLCRCDCGNTVAVAIGDLKRHHTKSCGCSSIKNRTEKRISHGRSKTKLYARWVQIKARCTNPEYKNWNHYGGRGIKLCDRWYDFENFLADMGEPAPGMSIDRIDNDGPYAPENCRWATRAEQMGNTRRSVKITWRGKTKHLAAWAREFGCRAGFLYYWAQS